MGRYAMFQYVTPIESQMRDIHLDIVSERKKFHLDTFFIRKSSPLELYKYIFSITQIILEALEFSPKKKKFPLLRNIALGKVLKILYFIFSRNEITIFK